MVAASPPGDATEARLTAVAVGAMLAAIAAALAGAPAVADAAVAVVYLAAGVPSAIAALRRLWRERMLDIDLLMILAALAAAAVGAPMEGAVLLTLFALSGALERRALGRARRAVEALMALRPDTALLRRAGSVVEVAAKDLMPGDVVILRPGARVPVDGTVIAGTGAVDEATITGESVPVPKAPGAVLLEATVNLDAVLEMRATRALADSTVARMIALVTEAQAARAPSERFSAWFGQRYTWAVLAGSAVTFAAFLALGREAGDALYRAATVLVAASPCAIVISVPAAILSGLAAAARGGVLFKGGAALETLARVRAFAFDKTGTLTTGRTAVLAIVPRAVTEAELLARLGGIEAQSEHPIAAAIRAECAARGLAPVPVAGVVARPSEGIAGGDPDAPVWAGNRRMAERMGAAGDLPAFAALLAGAGTVVFLGEGSRILGAVGVADRPRPTAATGLAALRTAGIAEIAMMTGDRRAVAERVGAQIGLRPEEIHADLLPGDKVRLVAGLAARGRVAFVGDGVNDAAALARADVGIAMGAAGSEVALQAADVALLSDDLTRLAAAHRLARRTARIIRQNLAFALSAMLLLVAGALFLDLPLPVAVIGHEGGTLLVVLNGLRLLADPIAGRPHDGRPADHAAEDAKAPSPGGRRALERGRGD
jgi:heavy metal translocating P-type ATPase